MRWTRRRFIGATAAAVCTGGAVPVPPGTVVVELAASGPACVSTEEG